MSSSRNAGLVGRHETELAAVLVGANALVGAALLGIGHWTGSINILGAGFLAVAYLADIDN